MHEYSDDNNSNTVCTDQYLSFSLGLLQNHCHVAPVVCRCWNCYINMRAISIATMHEKQTTVIAYQAKAWESGREWSSATGNVITVPQNYYKTSIFQLHCLHGLTTIWISKYQNENYTKWSNWGNPSKIYILIKFVIAEYSCKCTMDVYFCPIFFSRKEGDNEFMNIIVNEINTQVRFWSNRPLPVVGEVNISLLYCFCAAEGNFGFSDCRGGERSWSICSGRTQWTGGQAGTTVRARACLWSSHIAS